MPRPLDIRHDDVLGRLDWIESQMRQSRKASGDDDDERARLAEEYPVQMPAPGVFPSQDLEPASESPAVIDSIRAKTEAKLRHDQPLQPMALPPTEHLAADARAEAAESVADEQKRLGVEAPERLEETPSAPPTGHTEAVSDTSKADAPKTPPKADKGK